MKNITIYIWTFLIFVSCSDSKDNPTKLSDFLVNDSTTIVKLTKLDQITSSNDFDSTDFFKYSDLFKDVKYVKLASTEESSIGKIEKIEITNDGDYIVFDSHNGIIVRFDSTGTFMNHIGYRGHGDKEYIEPLDIAYDRFNNQVCIYDNAAKKILRYKINGSYMNEIKLKEYIGSFSIVDEKRLVLFMNHRQKLKRNEVGYNYKIITHTGELLTQFEAYEQNENKERAIAGDVFSTQEGRLLCHENYSSSIMAIDNEEIYVKYYVDMGNFQIPQEQLGLYSKRKEWFENHPDAIYFTSFYETEHSYILQLIKNRMVVLYCMNKNNTQNVCLGKIGINDINGIVSQTRFLTVNKNRIIFEIDPFQFQRTIELYNTNQGIEVPNNELEQIREMSHHTNPILQICTLK